MLSLPNKVTHNIAAVATPITAVMKALNANTESKEFWLLERGRATGASD